MSQEYTGKEKSLKSKFELVNAHKYKIRKHLSELEDKLYIITKKVSNPLFTEDLLKDTVIVTACPNIQQLPKIYVLIPSLEALVKRGFSKMGQIVTKLHWKIIS